MCSGCGEIESCAHLFLHCSQFDRIWQLVRNWLGVSSADPSAMVDHFTQFGTSAGLAKSRCSIMHLIWFASSWIIWKERNDGLFRAKECSPFQLLENIRLLYYSWYKAKFMSYHYKFHEWWQNTFLCVGIG